MEDISRQLDELEALEALFCEPGEFDLDDPELRERQGPEGEREHDVASREQGKHAVQMQLTV